MNDFNKLNSEEQANFLIRAAIQFNVIENGFTKDEIYNNKYFKKVKEMKFDKNSSKYKSDKLESTITSLFMGYGYDDPIEKAYEMYKNISKNHVFINGCKRTSILVADYFLSTQGLTLKLDSFDKFRLIEGIVDSSVDNSTGLEVFKSLTRELDHISLKTNNVNLKNYNFMEDSFIFKALIEPKIKPIDEVNKNKFKRKFLSLNGFLNSMNIDNELKELLVSRFLVDFKNSKNISIFELEKLKSSIIENIQSKEAKNSLLDMA